VRKDSLRASSVIDALDECKEESTTSTTLLALSKFTSHMSPVKFFITSRPVRKVVEGFRKTGLMKNTSALVLHSIPLSISEKDIHVYLETRLLWIAQSCGMISWPTSEDLGQLVELACGLFIFAATVANFIEDQNASSPSRQLEIVLSTGSRRRPQTHHIGLSMHYT